MDIDGNGELTTRGVDVGRETQEERANTNTLDSVIVRIKNLGIAPDYKPQRRQGNENSVNHRSVILRSQRSSGDEESLTNSFETLRSQRTLAQSDIEIRDLLKLAFQRKFRLREFFECVFIDRYTEAGFVWHIDRAVVIQDKPLVGDVTMIITI